MNFPWGDLLEAVVVPRRDAVRRLALFLKPGGRLDILVNMQVFEDAALRERLELPRFDTAHVDEIMKPVFADFGLAITGRATMEPGALPERTSWGRHLSVGSGRSTMSITAGKTQEAGSTE